MLGKDPDVFEGIQSEFVGHGLVFGKFMPPTNGHLHFIEFAKQSCRKLTIMVCSMPNEPIEGHVRYKWIKELFPDCNVVHHDTIIPQEPKTSVEDPDGAKDLEFFDIWKRSIEKHCPDEKFDALFASEEYGLRMADAMGISFIPVDIKRELVSISGTDMRNNPMKHWDMLHPVIRPYFLKKVAIVGPEGSGKTALSRQLAGHFQTVNVGEYVQSYLSICEKQTPGYIQSHMNIKDISTIARGQLAGENSLARQANRIMFCDNDMASIVKLSERKFGEVPKWVKKSAEEKKYDLYILMDPMANSKEDTCRNSLEERIIDFNKQKSELEKNGKNFIVLSEENLEKRFQNAVLAVLKNIPEMIPVPTISTQFNYTAVQIETKTKVSLPSFHY